MVSSENRLNVISDNPFEILNHCKKDYRNKLTELNLIIKEVNRLKNDEGLNIDMSQNIPIENRENIENLENKVKQWQIQDSHFLLHEKSIHVDSQLKFYIKRIKLINQELGLARKQYYHICKKLQDSNPEISLNKNLLKKIHKYLKPPNNNFFIDFH